MRKHKPNQTIWCRSIKGEKVSIPIEKMRFRNSVYSIIPHEDKLLIVRTRTTGLFAFPGGGIRLGEPIQTALRREVQEETGIQIEIKEHFHFIEDFFYFDPQDIGYHALMHFYLCIPLTTDLIAGQNVIDFYSEKPRWAPINELDPGQFQPGFREALNLYLQTQAK